MIEVHFYLGGNIKIIKDNIVLELDAEEVNILKEKLEELK